MRRAARQDDCQDAIVEALRRIGCKVYFSGKPLDLIVTVKGRDGTWRTILVECKDPAKRGHADEFTKEQRDFIDAWPGEIVIAHSVDEAINAVVRG